MSWPEVPLHDLCRPKQWPTIAVKNLSADGYPVYGANGIIGFHSEYTHSEPVLLIGCRGSCGNVIITEPMSYCNGNAMALDELDTTRIDLRYLYHFLKARGFDDIVSGSGQPQITQTNLRRVMVSCPPITEQRRIAAILDKADEIKKSSKQFEMVKNDLFRSLFIEIFGDPNLNPMNWETNPVIDYCTCIVPGRDKPKSFTGTTPWVTTADLNHLGTTLYSRDSIGLTDSEIEQVRARVIPKSSVILTCVGDLGVVSIAGTAMVVNQQLHTFQCSNKINNIFLMHSIAFQTPYMNKMASSTTVPYMNKTIANNIPTILPPLELQEKFANIVLDLSKLFEAVSQKDSSSSDLSKSLEQTMFPMKN